MSKNITKLRELYVEIMELLKSSNVKEENILKVDSILTEVDREVFYRDMGWYQDTEESDIEGVIDLKLLNIDNKEKHLNILPTNLELLLKMKVAGQNFFNKEYKADFKEDNIFSSGAVIQRVFENVNGEKFPLTKEEIQNRLIRQLERAYTSNNIRIVYDTGYITTVTKDDEKYCVLSTYCRK